MSEPLILVFTPEGTVEFTRNPQLYDFFQGEGDMERVSEIHKKPNRPEYYIKWLMGRHAGGFHTRDVARQYMTVEELHDSVGIRKEHDHPDGILLFPTYEAAVEHEVKMLNAMRRKGVTFGS